MARKHHLLGIFDSEYISAFKEACRYLRRPYVTGVSIGTARRKGKDSGLAVCIYVEEKFDLRLLSKQQVFPKQIAGIPTDVLACKIRRTSLSFAEKRLRRIDISNPAKPGVEIGTGSEFGTLGMAVKHNDYPTGHCILTAGHVLNMPNKSKVYQPGDATPANLLGILIFQEISARCDAAVVLVNANRALNNTPLGVNKPIAGCRQVKNDEILVKSGMMTGVTRAKVVGAGVMTYDGLSVQGFYLRPLDDAQQNICEEGDSGAIWYDEDTGEAVGLHVGSDAKGPQVSDERAFACHMTTVCEELNINV